MEQNTETFINTDKTKETHKTVGNDSLTSREEEKYVELLREKNLILLIRGLM